MVVDEDREGVDADAEVAGGTMKATVSEAEASPLDEDNSTGLVSMAEERVDELRLRDVDDSEEDSGEVSTVEVWVEDE